MFKAVAVAVIAMKSNNHHLGDARRRLEGILEQSHLRVPREQLAIHLKHGQNIEESVNITLAREEQPVDTRYRMYQKLLQTELQYQAEHEIYHHTILVGPGNTYVEVQDKIRAVMNLRSPRPSRLPLPLVLTNVQTIYAFGGLSESGKSTLAQSVCTHCSPGLACRTKIAYFLDQASEKIGKSVYNLPEKDQALMLLHELEDFSNRHYWVKVLTIESLHRNTMTMWLKTWLGDKLQVIYVDTADDLRYKRSRIPFRDVVGNDISKRERGADKIKSCADFVLRNDGSLDESLELLFGFLKSEKAHVLVTKSSE